MSYLLMRAVSKPGWAARKAYLWGRSIAGLQRSDVVMAFYPKTGSTWVRIVLYNLLAAQRGLVASDFDFDSVDASMPEFAHPSFFRASPFPDVARTIKTHRPYVPFWRGHKSIVFTREPRDTMVSFLHYANAKKEFGFSGGLDDLLRHPDMGLDSYFRFYCSWVDKAGLIVSYEDLRRSPVETFRCLLDYIGIEASEDELEAALEASSLEKTRKAQAQSSKAFQSKFAEGFVFARKGSVGEGRQIFGADQEAFFQSRRRHWGFDLYD